MSEAYDVIVVGTGNAAFSAAHAAREISKKVLMVEKADKERSGGNSYFTAGAFRSAFGNLEQLRTVLPDLTDQLASRIDIPEYGRTEFRNDLDRVTEGKTDPELADILVDDSFQTIQWLHSKGLRWELLFERQSNRRGDRIVFWGGLAIGSTGGGAGLIQQHRSIAEAAGIEIRYESPVIELLFDPAGGISGVLCKQALEDGTSAHQRITAKAVIIASGGFEANAQSRATYLGPGWDLAKVRGTEFNTGEVLHMALAAGAEAKGHWSGCHAIAWDANAKSTGDWILTNRLSRQGYPYGIMVNANAKRFVDEGADYRNYTYAKYGRAIMHQPGGKAFQLFDKQTVELLSEVDYGSPGTTRLEADSIRSLAQKMGLNPDELEKTVNEYNAAVQEGVFDPAIKDGKAAVGITPPKSNWALRIEHKPFVAFPVTCGITFSFGGLRIDNQCRVISNTGRPLEGLFVAGELVGGLFYHNYPGGSGLMSGAVFGRRAGRAAALRAMKDSQ